MFRKIPEYSRFVERWMKIMYGTEAVQANV